MLARALYYNGALDKPIPNSSYVAVAQVISYVYRLRRDGELYNAPPCAMPADLSYALNKGQAA